MYECDEPERSDEDSEQVMQQIPNEKEQKKEGVPRIAMTRANRRRIEVDNEKYKGAKKELRNAETFGGISTNWR
ncbi:hypothetical protein GWI33_009682 [Rhynchophorus ferrugineus]|uniref:Uncharacterized protein n=1 Tax=Rhynchophorus ferrugineus TaxID=354439 RepID=A0A834I9C3_RHYFE|nr:hypothetical protein GWI33_009682 [Rhynchophorus ferrugineus]